MTVSKKAITDELWRRGNLKWKCHSAQVKLYDIFYDAPDHSTLVWLLSRQTGKSFALGLLALEQALRKPHSIIIIVTDTKVHARTIFDKKFTELLEDCPPELKPEYNKSDYMYTFGHNGSQIRLAGTDGGHYERLRGIKASLVLVDEAGFCNQLEEVVKSILLPTTTHTGGKIVLSTTPPEELDHEFFIFQEEAEANNMLVKMTIYDNPLLTEAQREGIIKQYGGVNSLKFRREYLCEVHKSEETTVFPEADEALMAKIVKEWPRPPFYHAYVGMDLGYHDLTVVVMAYFDYKNDKVVFEDELVVKGTDLKLPIFAQDILLKEAQVFNNPDTGELIKPTARVSDINMIVTEELRRLTNHQLMFQLAKKDDKDAAINNMRVMLANEKIIINPRCKTLIRHIKNAKWDKRPSYNMGKQSRRFARSGGDGHYDAVDAACYLLRSINYNHNPYPAHYGINLKDSFVARPSEFYASGHSAAFQKIFGRKRR